MSIQNDKLMNLQDGQVLYNDLRDRIEDTKLNATLSTPTPVVSFPDGAPYPMGLTAAIDPVQDLHGYDHPWPGGGGKNKCTAGITTSRSVNDFTFTVNADDHSVAINGSNNPAGANVTFVNYDYASGTLKYEKETQYYIDYYPHVSGVTLSMCATLNGATTNVGRAYSTGGATATIPTDATASWLRFGVEQDYSIDNVKVYPFVCLASETDRSFVPYENICPITGWSGANVSVAGENLFGGEILKNTFVTKASATVDETNKTVSFYGRYFQTVNFFSNVKFKESTQYTFIFYGRNLRETSSKRLNLAILYTDGSYKQLDFAQGGPTTNSYCLYTSDAGKTILGIYGHYTTNSQTVLYYDQCGLFEGIKTVEDFVPYTGTSYRITFPTSAGTVYGGTVKVNPDGTGELVVDRIAIDLQNASLGTSGTNTQGKHRIRIQTGTYNTFEPTINNNTAKEYLKSNKYPTIPAGSIGTYGCHMGISVDTGGFLYLYDDEIQTVADAAASGTIVCVRIATPITYSLTPGQVLSLLGQNNVWADTGDIKALSYVRNTVPELIRQDTAGQISERVAPVESSLAIVVDGDIAPKNITSGQYVYVKNHSTLATGMYHATAAIAAGASIGNSNVNQDTDGLTNALNNSIININNKLPSESQSYQITGGLWINGAGARCLYLPVQLNKTPTVTKIELSGGTDITSDFNLGYSGNGQLFVYTWEYTYDGKLINVSYKLSN